MSHRALARRLLLLAVLPMICCGSARQASRPPRVAGSVATVSTLVEHAGRLDWSHATGLIAFDTLGADGYYDIGIVRADGSQRRNLTARHPDLPSRHVGQPAWHPSGDYLVVQAEKQVHPRAGLKRAVEPGAGVYNDLWLLVLESGRAYPLRVVADEPGNGVLHAHFSRDGSQLAWSEMYAPGKIFGKRNLLGRWRLMVADFSFETDGPLLSNIRAYEPGGPGFYENHGFSPDGGSLLFSSNFEGKGRLDSHIYTMDLRTERLVRLTQGRGWNEHAHYSPDGEHIAWMLRNSDRREKGTAPSAVSLTSTGRVIRTTPGTRSWPPISPGPPTAPRSRPPIARAPASRTSRAPRRSS
jgi:Tol biopolymer transport system component